MLQSAKILGIGISTTGLIAKILGIGIYIMLNILSLYKACPEIMQIDLISYGIRSVKCPTCANEGVIVWVIFGKCCPRCGTPCD